MTSKTILLTGANGFIGAHVLDLLLARGYIVRVSVRSQAKGEEVTSAHAVQKGKIEVVVVPDITATGAFDAAAESVDAIIHLASPFKYGVTDYENELLIPAINGTKSVLHAAAKHASVKRVIVLSSFAAVFDPMQGDRPGYVYTAQDWCPLTYEIGKAAPAPIVAYVASKTLAEKVVWEYLQNEKPSFDVVTLCPPMVFGPIAHSLNKLDDLNESNALFWTLATGKHSVVPPTLPPLWTDVRDVALAHVEALERPEAANKRYVLNSGAFSNQQICDVLRSNFPWAHTPVGTPGQALPEHYSLDASPATKELGIKFNPNFEGVVVDTVSQLKKLQDAGK